jgi:transmembrane sensor
MGALKDNITQLGKTVADSVDGSDASARVIAGARQRFLATVDEGAPDRSRLFGLWIVALGLACSLVGYWAIEGLPGWLATEQGPLTVSLEERETELVGNWISAKDETKQLRFSDGTRVSLHPHTKLQVEGTTSSGAKIVLSEGRALAQIEPLPGAKWSFIAGPFTVRVTGTEFDVAWFPEQGLFEIALHQGSVTLTGPSIEGAKDVRKGDFVRVALPKKAASLAPKQAAEGSASAGKTELSEDLGKTAGPTSLGRKEPSWRSHLAAGEMKEALSAIELAGSNRVLEGASARELWAVSDAARVHGRPALARDALLALRKKHGTRGETAYLLGKVHADQLNSPAEAIRWFDTYLSESPGGALAEQALGRLVELQAGTARGRKAARSYLERYPKGSYAEFARSSSR